MGGHEGVSLLPRSNDYVRQHRNIIWVPDWFLLSDRIDENDESSEVPKVSAICRYLSWESVYYMAPRRGGVELLSGCSVDHVRRIQNPCILHACRPDHRFLRTGKICISRIVAAICGIASPYAWGVKIGVFADMNQNLLWFDIAGQKVLRSIEL